MKSTITKLKPHDRIQLKLQGLAYGGYAYAKYLNNLIYVSRGAPEDLVSIRIHKLRKNFGSGEILQLIEPSPERIQPACNYFEKGCGGCQWLHLRYPFQLLWKKRILKKILHKLTGPEITVPSVRPAPNPLGCRNKFSILRSTSGEWGLMKENSQELIALKDCPQEMGILRRVYHKLIRINIPHQITQIHLRANQLNQISLLFFAEESTPAIYKLAFRLQQQIPELVGSGLKTYRGYTHLAGEAYLTTQVGTNVYQIPHNAFFQTNYEQAALLLKTVTRLLALSPQDVILDLHCGVGFFSIQLARQAKWVLGVETVKEAVCAARANSKINQLTNLQFIHTPALKVLKQLKAKDFTAAVLDPPRQGLGAELLKQLSHLAIPTLIYVSCNPDKLVCDLKYLLDKGYRITDCIPIDMFPQTWHVETVVKLVKA